MIFSLILSYKYSQDLLELLFACMRGKDGFNNNQNLRTFKAALNRTLIRTSIVTSKHANCILFEEQASNSIFFLKWTKSCIPLKHNKLIILIYLRMFVCRTWLLFIIFHPCLNTKFQSLHILVTILSEFYLRVCYVKHIAMHLWKTMWFIASVRRCS